MPPRRGLGRSPSGVWGGAPIHNYPKDTFMDTMFTTPLTAWHAAHGAKMVPFAGWEMPVQYGGIVEEHRAVRECGVVGRPDAAAGEIPVAFVALRDGFASGKKMEEELCSFVAERLTSYKQPREVHFVEVVPKTASGKILRRELRQLIH